MNDATSHAPVRTLLILAVGALASMACGDSARPVDSGGMVGDSATPDADAAPTDGGGGSDGGGDEDSGVGTDAQTDSGTDLDAGTPTCWSPREQIGEVRGGIFTGDQVELRAIDGDLVAAFGINPRVARLSTGWMAETFPNWASESAVDLSLAGPPVQLGWQRQGSSAAMVEEQAAGLTRVDLADLGETIRHFRITAVAPGVTHVAYSTTDAPPQVMHGTWDGTSWTVQPTGATGWVDDIQQSAGVVRIASRVTEFGDDGLEVWALDGTWSRVWNTDVPITYTRASLLRGSRAGVLYVEETDIRGVLNTMDGTIVELGLRTDAAEGVAQSSSIQLVHLANPAGGTPELIHSVLSTEGALRQTPIPETRQTSSFSMAVEGSTVSVAFMPARRSGSEGAVFFSRCAE